MPTPTTSQPNLPTRLLFYLGLPLLVVLLSACTAQPTSVAQINSATPPASATLALTATPAPSATASATETATATQTASATPTATLHPMMIEAMRQRTYPGSPITIEKELDPGVNYHRYYISYLSDGLKIYALLTIPNGEPPTTGWPVIIFNHGYIPPAQYRTTERYIAYVDNLARNGYIVLRSDYRGHDQSEGAAVGAYGDPGYVDDVLNAIGSIKQFPQADPDRIGMWGHSMGGYITLRSMVISKDIKVGVIWGGVVAPYPDIFARGPRPTSAASVTPFPGVRNWRTGWAVLYGSPEENPVFWNGVSANSFLADISGPIQLHHSVTDEEVPVAASRKLFEEMQAAGKEVELYTYEGDNHNIAGHFTQAMTRTIQFFDKYLKPND